MINKTYHCEICHSVNHISRFHCQHCGTIPERYSVLGSPARFIRDELDIPKLISVVVAVGAERLDRSRTVKTLMRTVPLDYYAEI